MTESQNKPVLIVEDDIDLLAMMGMVLSSEGYSVVTATNGKEALNQIDDQMPGLILLDMKMPIMDGWQFAERFYDEYDRAAPIVVVTAARDAKIWAREVGADGFLAKPFDIDDLIRTVAKFYSTPMGGAN